MRALIFGMAVVAILISGCRDQSAPAMDTLRSQMLRETCDALREGNAQDAEDALSRLEDAAGSSSFTDMAREWIEQKKLVDSINRALTEGRIETADDILAQASGGAFKLTASARPAVDALLALQNYLEDRPFASAREAERALQDLQPHTDVLLAESETFSSFLDEQKRALETQRDQELQTAAHALIEQLDLACVTGATSTETLLAHLEAIQPGHLLLEAWHATLKGNTTSLKPLRQALQQGPESRRAVEIGVALVWYQLDPASWKALSPGFADGAPASLSGILLNAVADADAGRWQDAVAGLKTLAATAPPGRDHVARMMADYLMPPRQFKAWCWQTPAPGIPEILSRIAQIRANQ